MTQHPLPLDRFSHIRIIVDFDAQQKDNREKYNDYQRAYRSKRKVQGNPACIGS